jgi:hypothetical protein
VSERWPRVPAQLSRPVHTRLTQIQAELEEDLQHPLTISETIEQLIADRAQLHALLEQR